MRIRVYVSGTLQQLQRLDENDKVKSARPATAEEVWMYDRLIAATAEAEELTRKYEALKEDNAQYLTELEELRAIEEALGNEPLPGAADVKAALDKIAAAGRKLAGPKGDRNG